MCAIRNEHKTEKERSEVHLALGEFAAEFEMLQTHLRSIITELLELGGLKNENMRQSIVSLKCMTAQPTLELFISLLADAGFYDHEEHPEPAKVLDRLYKALQKHAIERRNTIIHSTWIVPTVASLPEQPYEATRIKGKTSKQFGGARIDTEKHTSQSIRGDTRGLKMLEEAVALLLFCTRTTDPRGIDEISPIIDKTLTLLTTDR